MSSVSLSCNRETTLMTIEWANRVMTDKINPTVGRRFTTRGQILIFIIERREILIANCFKLFKLMELIRIWINRSCSNYCTEIEYIKENEISSDTLEKEKSGLIKTKFISQIEFLKDYCNKYFSYKVIIWNLYEKLQK